MEEFPIKVAHGWYSDTHQKQKEERNDRKHNFIYWLDLNDEPTLITHITYDENDKPKFDDVVYLGPLKRWYSNS
tara:strand:+ start:740 stop:961 length:222 start_codon:yes stop_codon:yes gene_type:complete